MDRRTERDRGWVTVHGLDHTKIKIRKTDRWESPQRPFFFFWGGGNPSMVNCLKRLERDVIVHNVCSLLAIAVEAWHKSPFLS